MRSRIMIAVTVAGLVLIAVVAAAGFGRGDAPSKLELAREADAICAEAKRKVEAAKPENTDVFAGGDVRSLAAIYRAAVKDLQHLDRSDQDEAAFGAIVADLDRGVRTLERSAARTPANGQVSWQQAFGGAEPHLERASSAAKAFGLDACAG